MGPGGSVTMLKRGALSIDAHAQARAPAEAGTTTESEGRWAVPAGQDDEEQPVSPTGRLFGEPHFNCYIVCVLGVGKPIDLAVVRPGLEANLARHPRFCSVQVLDTTEVGAKPKWVRTTVNLDDHIVIPDLDTSSAAADPDKVLEDYVSSLSALPPMDHSRPLWELHVLDFPTSEAASAVALRMHHSLGDGVSLLSLLIACTRSAADPAALPALPPAGRSGPLYALPPPRPRPLSAVSAAAGLRTLAAWVASLLALAWHTVADAASMAATVLFAAGDPPTVFMGEEGAEFRRKRFVSRILSLDDIKYIKNAMNCTVNDVLLGVTSAGLSRFHFRAAGANNLGRKNIRVRATLFVNIRPTPGLQTLSKMMESGDGTRWGNRLGFMMIPFDLATHEDPLEYVRRGAAVARRKKSSLECVLTYWSSMAVDKLFGIKAAAALCYKMFTNTTLLFSNTVGPIEPVVFCGHPIVYIAPAVYGLPKALSVHYQSYVNTMKLVIAVDETQFPDPHKLLEDFAESLRLIREAAAAYSRESS